MADVVVIGAGIIGLCCARALQGQGHRVTVLDRDPSGDKVSFGNAGGIGISEIVPASRPGVVWRVPGWLLDPLGPLSIRPAHMAQLAPWLWRFLRSGTSQETVRITAALAALASHTYQDLLPMMAEIGLADQLHRKGALSVYECFEGFKRDRAEWDLKRRFGVAWDVIDGDEARRREPALGPIVAMAVSTPDWGHVSDPKLIVDRLRDWLSARGVRVERSEVSSVENSQLHLASGQRQGFDKLVVAAGAWSGRIARQIGDRVLLESERGYNTTLPHPGAALNAEVIFAQRQFVATPLAMGLRIGGAAEFAGLDAPPNFQRSRALLELAASYLPGLDISGGTVWMGHRPTTPDSLPVISVSTRRRDVFYAFGHAHTGLTFGPTTGRLIADLVAGRQPPIDVTPYDIRRFN